tara:strand:+ start:566 stop:1102 length:537 start_codon:yes stop_codon:yes gene_type:complete
MFDKILDGIAILIISSSLFTLHASDVIDIPITECEEWVEYNEYANLDPESVILLSKLINSESHGEDFNDKLLVGSVIVNRMDSPLFPSTMWSVVYQKNQFSGLKSKYFRYNTDVIDGHLESAADYDSVLAAQRILKYGPIQPDIIFFLNPKISTNTKWVKVVMQRKLEVSGRNHLFYS